MNARRRKGAGTEGPDSRIIIPSGPNLSSALYFIAAGAVRITDKRSLAASGFNCTAVLSARRAASEKGIGET